MESPSRPVRKGRRNRRRGAELLEFTLSFIPMLAIMLVGIDVAWAIFTKSALQRAVRLGVRSGVTLTAAQVTSGGNLTDTVKDIVQQNALGLLNTPAKRAMIKVHYLQPPAANTTDAITDVCNLSNGNQPGNIMEVSVENFPIMALIPRVMKLSERPDNSPTIVTVNSADRIEPSRNPPFKGTAP